MRYKIVITKSTHKCPVCGTILKKEDDRWIQLLYYLTLVISFPALCAMNFIRNHIFTRNPEVPKVVKKHKECPCCKNVIRLEDRYTKDELTDFQALDYKFRWLLRIAYFFGGLAILSIFIFAGAFLESFDIGALLGIIYFVLPSVLISGVISIIYERKSRLLQTKHQQQSDTKDVSINTENIPESTENPSAKKTNRVE